MGADHRVFRSSGWVGLSILAIVTSSVAAQSPGSVREYRVLRSTTAPATNPPQVVPKAPQPYAYGWFGSKPQMHWHRQFGNRRSFTQWTLK